MNSAVTIRAKRYPITRIELGGFKKTLAADMMRGEAPSRVTIYATIAIALANEFAPAPQAPCIRPTFVDCTIKACEYRFDYSDVYRSHNFLRHALAPLYFSREVFIEHRSHDEAVALCDRISISPVLYDNPGTV